MLYQTLYRLSDERFESRILNTKIRDDLTFLHFTTFECICRSLSQKVRLSPVSKNADLLPVTFNFRGSVFPFFPKSIIIKSYDLVSYIMIYATWSQNSTIPLHHPPYWKKQFYPPPFLAVPFARKLL